MDMLQLKLFISVSQTLNFTKTASEFYMTQPTVSNHIKSLESSVGAKLLHRDSRKVSLTAAGREFVDYASRMLTLQLEAENRLRNISKGRSGYIKIAMLTSATEIFSECLSEFSKVQPSAQVDVDVLEGANMMQAISQSTHDICFADRHMIPDNDNIEYIVTGTGSLHLFINKSIADRVDPSDWQTLSGYHFVSVPEIDFSLSGQIKTICENRGIKMDIINYYSRANTVLLAVNSGIGVAILPPGLTYFYNFPNVVSIPIDGEDAVTSTVVAWNKDKLSATAQTFLQLEPLRRSGG